MDELARRLAELREDFRPPWTEQRKARALDGVHKMQQRQRRLVAATGAVGSALAVLGVVYAARTTGVWWTSRDSLIAAPIVVPAQPIEAAPVQSPVEPLPQHRPTRLADGSQVAVKSAGTQLYLERDRPEEIQLRLARGSAHFDVIPSRERSFRVISGAVEVTVVGTAFDVERSEERVRVVVSHGKVRVRSSSGEVFIQAGEARWFENAFDVATPATANKRETARKPAPGHKQSEKVEWRSLNQSGDYERAYSLLKAGAPVGEDVESLMEAADVARLSGHPAVAARYLEKLVETQRSNPATPLAAFTLGRLLLSQLARPSEAAAAFAIARELAPDGSLSQDALAREVEAWSKAGATKQAYLRAQLFVKKYPESRRRRLVEQYGGLDRE